MEHRKPKVYPEPKIVRSDYYYHAYITVMTVLIIFPVTLQKVP